MVRVQDYLTVPECAALLGCSAPTIRRWIKAGHIKEQPQILGRQVVRRCDCKRPAELDNRGAALFGRKRGGK